MSQCFFLEFHIYYVNIKKDILLFKLKEAIS